MKKITKKQLLNNLQNDVYCRIGVSKIKGAGVGVIAIKNILKGTDPFTYPIKISNPLYSTSIDITKKELSKLPKSIIKMIKDFCHNDNNSYNIPHYGLNSLDISWYLNNNINNNIDIIDNNNNFLSFVTNKNIKKGEELYINYNHFGI